MFDVDDQPGRFVRSRHDGEFYSLGLPPGDYEVLIPDDVGRAFRVRAADPELGFSVMLDDGWAQAPFLQVELVPDPS